MLARARAGGEMWTTSEHLQAAIVDLLQVIRWMYAEAHRPEHEPKQPYPVPLPRPGLTPAAEPEAPAVGPAELQSWLS